MVEIRNKDVGLGALLTLVVASRPEYRGLRDTLYIFIPSSRRNPFFRDNFSVEMAETTPNLNSLTTPEKCVADFCLIPVTPPDLPWRRAPLLTRATGQYLQIGTPTASVSRQIADVQRLMQQSSLKYSMHSAGTTVGTVHDSAMLCEE